MADRSSTIARWIASRSRGDRRPAGLQLEAGRDPVLRPGNIRFGLQDGEGTEGRAAAVARHVVVPAAAGIDRGPHRPALVEGADRDPGIAQGLQRHRAEQHRFAGAGRAEDQAVADVADVQVDPERRRAGRGAMHQRRRAGRIEGAGVFFAARPDAGQRQQIGQVAGVDHRPADVRDACGPAATAEPRLHGVHRLDPRREAFAHDLADDQPGTFDQRRAVRVHQDDDRRVVAEGDQGRAGLGDGRIRLAGHQQGVLVDRAALRLEHLRPEAANLLLPLAAEFPQFGQGLVLVEIDHARGPAKRDRQVVQRVEDPGEAFLRETFDRDAADEAAVNRAAQPRRVARPQFPAADDRIQVGAGGRDVQRNFLAGQGEMQVVHQMIAQMRPGRSGR